MLFWKKRNRRQPRKDEPSLLERIDWRAVATRGLVCALCRPGRVAGAGARPAVQP